MALAIIPSSEAASHGRRDGGKWPLTAEQQAQRLSPIARPAFKPSFHIRREDLLFTVGSCFARNLEQQMSIEGYDVAASRFGIGALPHDGVGVASNILNKYSCYTILQELQWAFGEGRAAPLEALHEVAPGKWLDPQLMPTLRPGPLENVLARRAAVEACFALAAEARIVVMTLGLAEAWYDRKFGLFLNGMVHKPMLRREPDRFELHLLDYNEIVACLEEIRALLVRHGRADKKILITVSPVALGTSYAGSDALVANAYSKAVQRAAVEAFVRAHRDVDYFPSYESVTLSDRGRAWRADQAHASDELVRLNVVAMMSAYCKDAATAERERRLGEAYDHLQAARAARAGKRPDEAAAAFARAVALAPGEALIRLEHGDFLLEAGRAPEAAEAYAAALAEGGAAYGGHEKLARALLRTGRSQEAYDAALKALEREPHAPGVLRLCSATSERVGRREEAVDFARRALEAARDMRHPRIETFERRCRQLEPAGPSAA